MILQSAFIFLYACVIPFAFPFFYTFYWGLLYFVFYRKGWVVFDCLFQCIYFEYTDDQVFNGFLGCKLCIFWHANFFRFNMFNRKTDAMFDNLYLLIWYFWFDKLSFVVVFLYIIHVHKLLCNNMFICNIKWCILNVFMILSHLLCRRLLLFIYR